MTKVAQWLGRNLSSTPRAFTFDEYQSKALKTANDLLPREKIINGALGLTGEAGEVADIVKKFIYHEHDLNKDEIEKELGDCLWYLALLADSIGTNLDKIAQKNIEKLKERYPNGFSSEASKNRKENK